MRPTASARLIGKRSSIFVTIASINPAALRDVAIFRSISPTPSWREPTSCRSSHEEPGEHVDSTICVERELVSTGNHGLAVQCVVRVHEHRALDGVVPVQWAAGPVAQDEVLPLRVSGREPLGVQRIQLRLGHPIVQNIPASRVPACPSLGLRPVGCRVVAPAKVTVRPLLRQVDAVSANIGGSCLAGAVVEVDIIVAAGALAATAALGATRAALVEAAERRADAGAHRDAAPVDVAGGGVLCERVADAAGDAAREHPAAHVRGHTAELADDESGDLPADDASGGSEQALDRAGAEGPERVAPVVDVPLGSVLRQLINAAAPTMQATAP